MHTDDVTLLRPGAPPRISAGLRARFAEEFGRDPDGVWFAPGRANINGEHVDFHGGRCLPMALAHGTYVAAAPRQDGRLRLRTLDPDLDDGVQVVVLADVAPASQPSTVPAAEDPSTDVHVLSPGETSGWTRYVAGTLWALQRLGAHVPELAVHEGFGADLLICSTLPIGGGLSSSAALECSAMLAFVALGTPLGRLHAARANSEHAGADNRDSAPDTALDGQPESGLDSGLDDALRAQLAAACMRAEVEVVGAGTGGLDQTVSLRGRAGHVLSLDCRAFTVEQLSANDLLEDHVFLAVDTGQAHWLGDGQFDDRRADSEAAMRLLGVDRLRDALPEAPDADHVDAVLQRFDELLSAKGPMGTGEGSGPLAGRDAGACRRRLRHALTEMLRSEQLDAILTADSKDAARVAATAARQIGAIMDTGHASMRDDAEVSFAEADTIAGGARTSGALGARLIGGGFGGSVLVLCGRDMVDDVIGGVHRSCADAGLQRPRFLPLEPSGAARRVG